MGYFFSNCGCCTQCCLSVSGASRVREQNQGPNGASTFTIEIPDYLMAGQDEVEVRFKGGVDDAIYYNGELLDGNNGPAHNFDLKKKVPKTFVLGYKDTAGGGTGFFVCMCIKNPNPCSEPSPNESKTFTQEGQTLEIKGWKVTARGDFLDPNFKRVELPPKMKYGCATNFIDLNQ